MMKKLDKKQQLHMLDTLKIRCLGILLAVLSLKMIPMSDITAYLFTIPLAGAAIFGEVEG